MEGLAQLVSASGCGPEGRGFESHISPQKILKAIAFRIFSFVPEFAKRTRRHEHHFPTGATSFDRKVNIIAARGTNERGCDKSQMMYFVIMLRLAA